jgi:PEGA domain
LARRCRRRNRSRQALTAQSRRQWHRDDTDVPPDFTHPFGNLREQTVTTRACPFRNVGVGPSLLRAMVFAAIACIWMTSLSGCVYRRLVVRSDPPGAQVILDGQEVGTTPVAVPFLYYGTRQLTLVKPGFETRTELVRIPAPWYQWMPIDFVSDNFLPRQVNDRHEICWQLNPQGIVPQEKLQERADSLRSEAHLGQ